MERADERTATVDNHIVVGLKKTHIGECYKLYEHDDGGK